MVNVQVGRAGVPGPALHGEEEGGHAQELLHQQGQLLTGTVQGLGNTYGELEIGRFVKSSYLL